MKHKIAIIVLSVVSTIVIGTAVYSTVSLNQKYNKLESITKIEEKEIETEPVEVTSDNYNQRFEDLSNRITELEAKLSQSEEKIINLENTLQNYEEIEDLVSFIRKTYINTNYYFVKDYNIPGVCTFYYINNDTNNEYYQNWCSYLNE